jgi:hypothetical protein
VARNTRKFILPDEANIATGRIISLAVLEILLALTRKAPVSIGLAIEMLDATRSVQLRKAAAIL